VRAGLHRNELRTPPQHFEDVDRAAYLTIALRSCTEAINCYTVMALGLQAYVANTELARS